MLNLKSGNKTLIKKGKLPHRKRKINVKKSHSRLILLLFRPEKFLIIVLNKQQKSTFLKASINRHKTVGNRPRLFSTSCKIRRTRIPNTGRHNRQKQTFLQNRFFTIRVTRPRDEAVSYILGIKCREWRWRRINILQRRRIMRGRWDVRRNWEIMRALGRRVRVRRKGLNFKRICWRLHGCKERELLKPQCTRKCTRRFLKNRRGWCILRHRASWKWYKISTHTKVPPARVKTSKWHIHKKWTSNKV